MHHSPFLRAPVRARLFGAAWAVGLLVIAGGTLRAQSGPTKRPAFVKVTATAEKPRADGKQDVLITLDIEKGVTLIANPAGNEDLEDSSTRAEVTLGGTPVRAALAYPAGTKVEDKLIGDYHIYTGTIVIHANVRRPPGDPRPLEIAVRMWGFRPTH